MKTIQERYEEIKNDQDITDKIDKLIIDCYHYKIFREKASSKYKKSFKDDFEQDYPTYVTVNMIVSWQNIKISIISYYHIDYMGVVFEVYYEK